jgi:hypothetical protein
VRSAPFREIRSAQKQVPHPAFGRVRNDINASFPVVENFWKSCEPQALTAFPPHGMFVRFRGQSESCVARAPRPRFQRSWRAQVSGRTECAPLRRIAIRSLTTRLNVPVVRNEFGHNVRTISQDVPLRVFFSTRRVSAARERESGVQGQVSKFQMFQGCKDLETLQPAKP